MSTMNTNGSATLDQPLISLRQRDALIAICIMAALADGKCDDGERERIKQIVTQLTGSHEAADTVFQRVQFYQTTMTAEAAELTTPELRGSAYEMAVGLVNADGVVTSGESSFLDALADALGIDPKTAARALGATDTLAAAHPETPSALVPPPPPGAAKTESEASKRADSTVQTYSIVAAAMELLPQTLASMAIIPLQMKMVYAVGKEYGYSLDSGHIKDLLATVGVGVTSQVFEGYARRLMSGLIGKAAGGLLGKSAGKMGEKVGNVATGAAVTFATTFALGKVAKQYYAGGRKLSAIDLQSLFTKEVSSAQKVYQEVAPQIQAQARTLNPANILKMVRG
jgi:uncharacterized protein (DUF697 family)/tellurite resistance protein